MIWPGIPWVLDRGDVSWWSFDEFSSCCVFPSFIFGALATLYKIRFETPTDSVHFQTTQNDCSPLSHTYIATNPLIQVWMAQIIGVFIVIMLEVNVVKVCFTTCSTWQIRFFGPPWRLKPEPHDPWAWCWMVAAGCMRIPCACGAFPRCLGLVATLLKKDAARKLACFVQILDFVFVGHSVFCLLCLEMDGCFVCVAYPELFPIFEPFKLLHGCQPVGNAAWSSQEIVAYHKIIEGGGCSEYLPPKLKTFPSDEDENLYIGSTQPTYAIKEEEDKKKLDLSPHYTLQDVNIWDSFHIRQEPPSSPIILQHHPFRVFI